MQRKTHQTRTLQQQGQFVIVNTPQELLDAAQDGARHVEIRSHLDLTSVPHLYSAGKKIMLDVGDITENRVLDSIVVR